MKKALLIFFFLIFILSGNIRRVYAQPTYFNVNDFLPGIGCGVPTATGSANLCCTTQTVTCGFGWLENILDKIPVVSDVVKDFAQKCDQIKYFQSKNGSKECIFGEPDRSSGKCICTYSGTTQAPPEIEKMCRVYLSISNPQDLEKCITCKGYYSALGCIPLSVEGFVQFIFSFGIGLAGIIALLCIIYSAFMIQASSGNPEKIKKSQENLTSCILGLMLIIFSIFILKFIGLDILRIPSFVK